MSLNWNSNPRSLGFHIDIHLTELLTQFYGTSQVFVYTTYLVFLYRAYLLFRGQIRIFYS